MRIYVDDGSTNIKLAWKDENGEVKTFISPNSFKPEWSLNLSGTASPQTMLSRVKSFLSIRAVPMRL